jgi:hypothetical protein
LRERARRDRDSGTLLRPTQPDHAGDALLRPVTTAGVDPSSLLRSAEVHTHLMNDP